MIQNRRNLKILVQDFIDVVEKQGCELTTAQLKQIFLRKYSVELTTKEVRYILDMAMNECNRISKTKYPNGRLSYK